jgi:hypothetical protein
MATNRSRMLVNLWPGKDGVRVAAGTGLVHDKLQPVPVGQDDGYRGAVTGVLPRVLRRRPWIVKVGMLPSQVFR